MPKQFPRRAHTPSCKGPFNNVPAVFSDTSCRKLLNLFLGLPGELQVGVLCNLSSNDVFSLRATCRAFYKVIDIQASPIVRHLVKTRILAKHLGDYTGMYPLPEPTSPLNLDYLYDLSHRLHVVNKLSRHIANFLITKIFHFNTSKAFRQSLINNMVYNMRPMLLILLHFFESYRATLVRYADKRLFRSAFGPGFIPCWLYEESEIMRKYDDPAQLLQAHNMYRLLSWVLRRRLRTPSYAGRLESALRGWGKKPATKESIVQLLTLGGLKEVNNVLDARSYGARLKTLQKYLPGTLPSAEQRLAMRKRSSRLAREGASRFGREMGPVNGSVHPRVVLTVRDSHHSRPCPALRKISCSVMQRLDTQTAFEVSLFLPDLDSLWFTAAERHLIQLGVIRSKADLPHLFHFIAPFIAEETDLSDDEIADG